MSTRGRVTSSSSRLLSSRSRIGAGLLGATLLVGSLGTVAASQATPSASPAASPAASPVAAWIADVAIDPSITVDGDSTTVGLKDGELLEINAASFEARPFVTLQTSNLTDAAVTFVVFSVPEGTEAEGFTIPADAADLPEGVTPVASYVVEAGADFGAVFVDLTPGSYLIATSDGKALGFTVTEAVELDVPDIFASPAA